MGNEILEVSGSIIFGEITDYVFWIEFLLVVS